MEKAAGKIDHDQNQNCRKLNNKNNLEWHRKKKFAIRA